MKATVVVEGGGDKVLGNRWGLRLQLCVGLVEVGLASDKGLLKMMGGNKVGEAGGGGWFEWDSGGARLGCALHCGCWCGWCLDGGIW